MQEPIHKQIRDWRLAEVAIAFVLFLAITEHWLELEQQSNSLLERQTQQQAEAMLAQIAIGASSPLKFDDVTQLEWLAKTLIADPRIISASIFDDEGVRLVFQQRLPESPTDEGTVPGLSQFAPYTAPILQDDQPIGYLRLRFDMDKFFVENRDQFLLHQKRWQMLLILAAVIGLLLARAISRKRAAYSVLRYQQKKPKSA